MPSDEFGGQELATHSEIAGFLAAFKPKPVTFTILEKGMVNGPGATPFYQFFKEASGSPKDIRWNFATQFLITPDGSVSRFDGKAPNDLVPAIEDALKAAGASL